MRPGALLGVADGPAGGHQAQFTRADRLEAARGVAVQHLALVQPADGLQAHVRVRRDPHAGLVDDVVRAVVIDEAPGPDHAAAQIGQQTTDFAGLAELYPTGTEEFTHRFGHHESPATAHRGHGFAIEIAHGAQPSPVAPRRQAIAPQPRPSRGGRPSPTSPPTPGTRPDPIRLRQPAARTHQKRPDLGVHHGSRPHGTKEELAFGGHADSLRAGPGGAHGPVTRKRPRPIP